MEDERSKNIREAADNPTSVEAGVRIFEEEMKLRGEEWRKLGREMREKREQRSRRPR